MRDLAHQSKTMVEYYTIHQEATGRRDKGLLKAYKMLLSNNVPEGIIFKNSEKEKQCLKTV